MPENDMEAVRQRFESGYKGLPCDPTAFADVALCLKEIERLQEQVAHVELLAAEIKRLHDETVQAILAQGRQEIDRLQELVTMHVKAGSDCLKEIDRLQEQVEKHRAAFEAAAKVLSSEFTYPTASIPGYNDYRRAACKGGQAALGPVEWMLEEIDRLNDERERIAGHCDYLTVENERFRNEIQALLQANERLSVDVAVDWAVDSVRAPKEETT